MVLTPIGDCKANHVKKYVLLHQFNHLLHKYVNYATAASDRPSRNEKVPAQMERSRDGQRVSRWYFVQLPSSCTRSRGKI